MNIILYTFAGRQANMELQIPFVRRILAENTNVQWHVWNLTRTGPDDRFVRSIEGERISVINGLHQGDMSYRRFNDVWRHYASQRYRNHHFVKMDDDIVFIETDGFRHFTETVRTNPEHITSATVVNNGACLDALPEDYIMKRFVPLNIPLLDVHLSGEFAQGVHEEFLEDPFKALGRGGQLRTSEWLSINMIGYSWGMGLRIVDQIGRRCDGPIAGRDFPGGRVGDEGACNMFPRLIDKAMTAAHLTFGPQKLPESTWDELRARYAVLAKTYLDQ